MEKIFFQSSLPRSGSTLLQNILGQNPDFYVTPTSGVLELLYGSRSNFTGSSEFKAQDKITMESGFKSFCKNGLEGFYRGIPEASSRKYVIDKSRGWGIHYGFLNEFYPNPKIICMVRDLRSIFSSMEKNFRKSQLNHSEIVNHSNLTGTTTEKRINIWANSQPVGLAIERLQEMFKQGISNKVLFVRYEDLTTNPSYEIQRIYDYLEVDQFKHDFNNVEQITVEDDSVYGAFGDHIIRKEVSTTKEDWNNILGIRASESIKQSFPWFYQEFSYE